MRIIQTIPCPHHCFDVRRILTVHVSLGKDTITVSDHGIGLTAEEIDKYINPVSYTHLMGRILHL